MAGSACRHAALIEIGAPSAIARIRDVLDDAPATEAELRTLASDAGGWLRVLEARLAARERGLRVLSESETSSIAEIADELRTVYVLRREVADTRSLIERLDERARELRGRWVRR